MPRAATRPAPAARNVARLARGARSPALSRPPRPSHVLPRKSHRNSRTQRARLARRQTHARRSPITPSASPFKRSTRTQHSKLARRAKALGAHHEARRPAVGRSIASERVPAQSAAPPHPTWEPRNPQPPGAQIARFRPRVTATCLHRASLESRDPRRSQPSGWVGRVGRARRRGGRLLEARSGGRGTGRLGTATAGNFCVR